MKPTNINEYNIAVELEKYRYPDSWYDFFRIKTTVINLKLLKLVAIYLRDEGSPKTKAKLNIESAAVWIQKQITDIGSSESNDLNVGKNRRLSIERLASSDQWPSEFKNRNLTDFLIQSKSRDNKVNSNARLIKPTCAVLLIEYLMHTGLLLTDGITLPGPESAIALTNALMNYFAVTDRTKQVIPEHFAGHYFVYRRSAHWPGRFVKAYLEVRTEMLEKDTHSYALCTVEKHIHHGNDGSARAEETYVGVMSRKSGYPFILSSLTDDSLTDRNAPRFTLINSTIFERGTSGRVASMSGITCSPFGEGHAWASPVCIERTDDIPTDAQIGLFSDTDVISNGNAKRIPESVQARLNRPSAFGF